MGGLADLLRLNRDVRVYLPGSCSRPPEAREVISVQGPLEISENFFSTGELPGAEQSLVVKTEKGLAVICGCSHPGVGTILKAASRFGRVSALIGGLHGFKEYEVLEDLSLVCPCHCAKHCCQVMRSCTVFCGPANGSGSTLPYALGGVIAIALILLGFSRYELQRARGLNSPSL